MQHCLTRHCGRILAKDVFGGACADDLIVRDFGAKGDGTTKVN